MLSKTNFKLTTNCTSFTEVFDLVWQGGKGIKAILAGGGLSKWDRAGKICEVELKAVNASSRLVVHTKF